MSLTIHLTSAPPVGILALHGDFDAASAAAVRRAASDMLQRCRYLLIGLAKVTFFDCAAVGMLAALNAQALARGGWLTVVARSRPAAHVLAIFGMHTAFRADHDLGSAYAAALRSHVTWAGTQLSRDPAPESSSKSSQAKPPQEWWAKDYAVQRSVVAAGGHGR